MKRFLALLILVFALPAAPVAALGPPTPDLWERWTAHDPASTMSVDHCAWDTFLSRYLVASGDGVNRVAYGRVSAADRQALAAYIDRLAAVPVSTLARPEQMAYWINLYNALTVKVILDHYPVDSILDVDISPGIFSEGPWGRELVEIEGEGVSLDDIEHRILRPIWADPRIHYAVNCASIGCPNLAPTAYTAATLEAMLDAGARVYVNHSRGVTIADDGMLTVSSVYAWFDEDFGVRDANVIAHLKTYADPALKERLEAIENISDQQYDWPGLHRFFCDRAIPGVESCAAGRYERTIEVGGSTGTVAVRGDADGLALAVDIGGAEPSEAIVGRFRTMFDVDADPAPIGETLAADPHLAPLVAARPGLRVPGCWDPFEPVVRAVLGQQTTVAAARTLAGRLVERFGRELTPDSGCFLFPSPAALADADVGAIGLPRRRAETLRAVARAVASGMLVLDGDKNLETTRAQLLAIPVIGEWTVDYVSLRALKDSDAFPAGDLGLVRAAKRLGIAETPADLRTAAEAWRPWRAYAGLHRWQSLGDNAISRDDRGGR